MGRATQPAGGRNRTKNHHPRTSARSTLITKCSSDLVGKLGNESHSTQVRGQRLPLEFIRNRLVGTV